MLAASGQRPVKVALEGDAIGARGYVDLTCAAMRRFGAQVEQQSTAAWVVQPGGYCAADLRVEPDASAATCLWAAESLTGGDINIGIALRRLHPTGRPCLRPNPPFPPHARGDRWFADAGWILYSCPPGVALPSV